MSNSTRKERNKKGRKPLFIILLLIKFFLLLAMGGTYYYFSSQQKQVSYFHIENPIVFQGEIYEKSAVFNNNQLYLPFQFISDHLDEGITYDEQTKSVIIISNETILRFPIEKLEKYVNEEPLAYLVYTFLKTL
uniref:Copper amine oxidase-like N-terminal domain-containing protein n=1 Tax=Anaerobacillus isosaccharinicus TaxID=1532552 RepID=A0A1S2KXC1_9BACI